jgi:hypothetical protein
MRLRSELIISQNSQKGNAFWSDTMEPMTRNFSTRCVRVGGRLVAGAPGGAAMWVETLAPIGAG